MYKWRLLRSTQLLIYNCSFKKRGGPREEEIIIHVAQLNVYSKRRGILFWQAVVLKKKLGYEDKQIVAWQATIWNAYYSVIPLCG